MIPFRSLRMPLCALAFAGVFAAGAGLPAVALDANDRKQVEAIIKEYLIKNPEVLRDAIMELQKREAEAESKQRAAAVKQNQKLIYEFAARGRHRQQERRCHPGRVLRLQLRLLQARARRHGDPHEGRHEA